MGKLASTTDAIEKPVKNCPSGSKGSLAVVDADAMAAHGNNLSRGTWLAILKAELPTNKKLEKWKKWVGNQLMH